MQPLASVENPVSAVNVILLLRLSTASGYNKSTANVFASGWLQVKGAFKLAVAGVPGASKLKAVSNAPLFTVTLLPFASTPL